MNKPHKHAELIKLWADGAQIQAKEVGYFADDSEWMDVKTPTWNTHIQYRIKPKTISFRVGLFINDITGPYPATVTTEETEKYYNTLPHFYKWLTDWQEVEI